MKMKIFYCLMGLVMLMALSATAMSVDYTVTARTSSGEINYNSPQTVNQDCASSCTVALPSFSDIPEGYTFKSYILSYTEGNGYVIKFSSTGGKASNTQDDTIIIDITLAQNNNDNASTPVENVTNEPTIKSVCNDVQCDLGCSRCSDDKCHEPGFVCKEEITIDKVVPESLNLGDSQINILLRNTGSVDVKNVYAEVSGDGLSTLDKLNLDKLAAGDKDYVFVKVTATKPGTVDLVVKLYVNNKLNKKTISQVTVLPGQQQNNTATLDTANLSGKLDDLKLKYRNLEQLYLNKKAEDYPVDMIYDGLRKAHDYLIEAQSAYFEGNYKKTNATVKIVEDDLTSIEQLLNNIKKKQVSFSDKLKENLGYIASIAAALITIVSAVTLVRSHINKERIAELGGKLKIKKKEESSEKISETAPIESKKEVKLETKKEKKEELTPSRKIKKSHLKPKKSSPKQAQLNEEESLVNKDLSELSETNDDLTPSDFELEKKE